MSMQHWKKNTVVKPELQKHFQNIIAYAKEKQKVITIFDLEATTFMGRPNFGVTELGMVHITPSGNIGVAGSLVNPERSIAKEVAELTGITNAMVRDLPNWGELWLEAISYIAEKHVVIGFNSTSFDMKALQFMHKRHGVESLEFGEHMDLRTIVNRIDGSTKGKLPEIAERFNIDTSEFEGHRATNDALLTAKILDVVMERHPDFEKYLVKASKTKDVAKSGDSVSKEPKEKRAPSPFKADVQTMLSNTFGNGQSYDVSMFEPLLDVLSLKYPDKTRDQLKTSLSFELGSMIDAGIIPVLEPKDSAKQRWLSGDLYKRLVEAAWSDPSRNGKLAPALEMTDAANHNAPFDYIDIRWGLHVLGMRKIQSLSATGPSVN